MCVCVCVCVCVYIHILKILKPSYILKPFTANVKVYK